MLTCHTYCSFWLLNKTPTFSLSIFLYFSLCSLHCLGFLCALNIDAQSLHKTHEGLAIKQKNWIHFPQTLLPSKNRKKKKKKKINLSHGKNQTWEKRPWLIQHQRHQQSCQTYVFSFSLKYPDFIFHFYLWLNKPKISSSFFSAYSRLEVRNWYFNLYFATWVCLKIGFFFLF